MELRPLEGSVRRMSGYQEKAIAPVDLGEVNREGRDAVLHRLPIRRDGRLHHVYSFFPQQVVAALARPEHGVGGSEALTLQEVSRDGRDYRAIERGMARYHDANRWLHTASIRRRRPGAICLSGVPAANGSSLREMTVFIYRYVFPVMA